MKTCVLAVVCTLAVAAHGQWREAASVPVADPVFVTSTSDGTAVFFATRQGIFEWKLDKGSVPRLRADSASVIALAVGQQTRVLAMAKAAGITVEEFGAGKEVDRLAFAEKVQQLVFSPDDRTLAIVTAAGVVWFWRRGEGATHGKFQPGFGGVEDVAFSPDGALCAIAADDANIYILDVRTGTVRKQVTDLQTAPFSVVFSPDGKSLYAGGAGKTVFAFDTANWKLQRQLPTQDTVGQLAISGDGRRLAALEQSADASRIPAPVVVWDISGAGAREIARHERRPGSRLRFVPSGELLFTQWDGANLRVYSLK